MEDNKGLAVRAYHYAKQAILCGKYSPGEALYESHLATDLGMSRTPVREALQELAREGFIEANPARGYLVPRFSIEDLRELFELRESLEGIASRGAAKHASETEIEELERICGRYGEAEDLESWAVLGTEFHSMIVAICRNRRLATILESLNCQIIMCRRSSLKNTEYRRDDVLREHLEILNAIKARDGDAAEQLTRMHVRNSYETSLRIFNRDSYRGSAPPCLSKEKTHGRADFNSF